jgi:hypothetical protein
MHKKPYTNGWNGLELGYFPYIRVWKISLLLNLFQIRTKFRINFFRKTVNFFLTETCKGIIKNSGLRKFSLNSKFRINESRLYFPFLSYLRSKPSFFHMMSISFKICRVNMSCRKSSPFLKIISNVCS